MFFRSKPFFILAILGIIIGAGAFVFFPKEEPVEPPPVIGEEPEPLVQQEVIGTSVEGREIEAYTYGSGKTRLAFIGGIHGGYEWNSVLLSYELMDYLEANPDVIPENVMVTVIPVLNPDGLYTVLATEGRFTLEDAPKDRDVTIPGRFNANGVDLNRNFDCKWASESTWRGNVVSAGTAAFSEPEAAAFRDFALRTEPAAAFFFHSKANTVYASECEEGILPETLDILAAYTKASGYNAVESFDAYPITGDVEGWLASIGIPALTVELKNHDTIEWEQNLSGIEALFSYYSGTEFAQ